MRFCLCACSSDEKLRCFNAKPPASGGKNYSRYPRKLFRVSLDNPHVSIDRWRGTVLNSIVRFGNAELEIATLTMPMVVQSKWNRVRIFSSFRLRPNIWLKCCQMTCKCLEIRWFGGLLICTESLKALPQAHLGKLPKYSYAKQVSRVWTQFNQHLIAKSCNIDKKFTAFFSKRVASLRISFILQKNRSTMLRIA